MTIDKFLFTYTVYMRDRVIENVCVQYLSVAGLKRDRETRQTERQRETEREIGSQRQTDRRTDGQSDRQRQRQRQR